MCLNSCPMDSDFLRMERFVFHKLTVASSHFPESGIIPGTWLPAHKQEQKAVLDFTVVTYIVVIPDLMGKSVFSLSFFFF